MIFVFKHEKNIVFFLNWIYKNNSSQYFNYVNPMQENFVATKQRKCDVLA